MSFYTAIYKLQIFNKHNDLIDTL